MFNQTMPRAMVMGNDRTCDPSIACGLAEVGSGREEPGDEINVRQPGRK